MIYSMTGYGKSDFVYNSGQFTIEIKTLNSKGVDINCRLPTLLKPLETDLRAWITEALQRGKIDVYVNGEVADKSSVVLNQEFISAMMEQMALIAPEASIDKRFEMTMRLSEATQNRTDELTDEIRDGFRASLNKAVDAVKDFRKVEGEKLFQVFQENIAQILELLQQVEPFEKERITNLKDRIHKSLSDFKEVDENRLEQELVYYLEKLDITEEKVRLRSHCEYFLEQLNSDESNGKKMGFILQEIGREINTLGSKANHAGLQKIVVQMKDNLEQMKEQMLNVL